MNYDELGDLREADWARPPATCRAVEGPRRPPAPTPASEQRERTARTDRAERCARRIASLREAETMDEVAAHRLGTLRASLAAPRARGEDFALAWTRPLGRRSGSGAEIDLAG